MATAADPAMRQVFLDTETTGLSPDDGHRIVEIACVEAVDGLLTGREFHHYLDPDREVPPEAAAIHGLTTGFLRGKPRFRDIASELIAFVRGATVLIHHAPFDLAFLDAEFRICRIAAPFASHCAEVADTLPVFRALHPGESCTLAALCERRGVKLGEGEVPHSALCDARLLARLWAWRIHVGDRERQPG
jgi:DNA polymerase III subunit epsilon